MYVFKHHYHGGHHSTHLYEMTAKEFREAEAAELEHNNGPEGLEQRDGIIHEKIHFTRAHAWVKSGGIHSTPLYTDEGRIRYARDGY